MKFSCKGGEHNITLNSPEQEINYMFTRGHCHSFALAVNKLTGWSLVGLFTRWDGEMASHVVNRTPDGRLFDVEGFELHGWSHCEARDITVEDIAKWEEMYRTQGRGYYPANPKNAMKFAKAALKSNQVSV